MLWLSRREMLARGLATLLLPHPPRRRRPPPARELEGRRMAADDELPRGWTQSTSTPAGPTGVSITWPAVPGIAWVLTDIHETMFANFAGDYEVTIVTNVGFGGAGGPIGKLDVNLPANGGGSDTYDWSGKVYSPPNTALTVTVSSIANAGSFLTATAYPM